MVSCASKPRATSTNLQDLSTLITLSGDVHANPGPQIGSINPELHTNGYTSSHQAQTPYWTYSSPGYAPRMLGTCSRLEQMMKNLETSMGEKLDGMQQELAYLIDCVNGLCREQEQLRTFCHESMRQSHFRYQYLSDWNASIQGQQDDMKKTLVSLSTVTSDHQSVRTERMRKMNSARFFGVHEEMRETDEQCFQSVLYLLQEALPEVPWTVNKIIGAERLGDKASDSALDSPRPVLVTFDRTSDKMLVLRRGRHALRRMGIRISGSFAPQQSNRPVQNKYDGNQLVVPRGGSFAPEASTMPDRNASRRRRRGTEQRRTQQREFRASRTLVHVNIEDSPPKAPSQIPNRGVADVGVGEAEVAIMLRECRREVHQVAANSSDIGVTEGYPPRTVGDRAASPRTRDSSPSTGEDEDHVTGENAWHEEEDHLEAVRPALSAARAHTLNRRDEVGPTPCPGTPALFGSRSRAVQSSMLDWLKSSGSGLPELESGIDGATMDDHGKPGSGDMGRNGENSETGVPCRVTSAEEYNEEDRRQSQTDENVPHPGRGGVWQGRLRPPADTRLCRDDLGDPSSGS